MLPFQVTAHAMEMNRARPGDGRASVSCYFCRVVSEQRWSLNRDSKAGERAGAVGGVAGRAARVSMGRAWRRED